MYLNYPELIQFSNGLTYGNMYEANVTKSVYSWVEAISYGIDSSYSFIATYIYNQFGVAVEANIMVQRKVGDDWLNLGTYSSSFVLPCPEILLSVGDTPSNPIESDSLHYYVNGYYETGYYV